MSYENQLIREMTDETPPNRDDACPVCDKIDCVCPTEPEVRDPICQDYIDAMHADAEHRELERLHESPCDMFGTPIKPFTPSEFRNRIALQLMPPTPLEVLDNVVSNYKARIAKLEGTLLGIKLALQQQGGYENTISLIDSAIFEEVKS